MRNIQADLLRSGQQIRERQGVMLQFLGTDWVAMEAGIYRHRPIHLNRAARAADWLKSHVHAA